MDRYLRLLGYFLYKSKVKAAWIKTKFCWLFFYYSQTKQSCIVSIQPLGRVHWKLFWSVFALRVEKTTIFVFSCTGPRVKMQLNKWKFLIFSRKSFIKGWDTAKKLNFRAKIWKFSRHRRPRKGKYAKFRKAALIGITGRLHIRVWNFWRNSRKFFQKKNKFSIFLQKADPIHDLVPGSWLSKPAKVKKNH